MNVNANRGKNKKTADAQSFANEIIRPCLCETSWHRACIREKIVRNEILACPTCKFEFSVGYSDCYAILNKKRPNYLAYMLVQELVLTAAQWLCLIAILVLFQWLWNSYNT